MSLAQPCQPALQVLGSQSASVGGSAVQKQLQNNSDKDEGEGRGLCSMCFHSKVVLCVLAAAGRIAQLSCASTRNLRNDLFAVAFSLRASDSCMYKWRHFLEGLLFSHSIRRTRLFVACCLMSAVPRLSLLERFSSPSDALT